MLVSTFEVHGVYFLPTPRRSHLELSFRSMAMAHGLVPQSQDSTYGSQFVVVAGTCQYLDCRKLEQEHHKDFHPDEGDTLRIASRAKLARPKYTSSPLSLIVNLTARTSKASPQILTTRFY